jgi:integrase
MQSFADFLRRQARIDERRVVYYERWVHLFQNFRKWHKEKEPLVLGDDTMVNAFIASMGSRYPDWQVAQAKHALQLYVYYSGRRLNQQTAMQTEDPKPVPDPLQPMKRKALSWDEVEEQVSRIMRLKHLSFRTERSYSAWILRFQHFLGAKPCAKISENDLKAFLSYLAVEKHVAAATQKLAFNALLFLFRNILDIEINGLSTVVPAKVPKRLPVVLTKEEVRLIFSHLEGTSLLMANVIYGGRLRLQECLSLRVKDIDFGRNCLVVKSGKGQKDRETVLPDRVVTGLRKHLENVRIPYDKDRRKSIPGVSLPDALQSKHASAGTEWGWFWVFPSASLSIELGTRTVRRYHQYPTTLQKAFRDGAGCRYRQECFHPHAAAQLCDTPRRTRLLGVTSPLDTL